MARVYKEIIKIKHYGNFEKIVNVSKKGAFSVRYPVCVVCDEDAETGGGVLQTDECYARTMSDLEDKFKGFIAEFIALHEEYEDVILYKWKKSRNYINGSGFGFELDWGVYKRLKVGRGMYKRYFYVRGQEGKEYRSNPEEKDVLKEGWKEIKYSEKREEFFRKTLSHFYDMFDAIDGFFTASNLEDMVDNMDLENGIRMISTKYKIES